MVVTQGMMMPQGAMRAQVVQPPMYGAVAAPARVMIAPVVGTAVAPVVGTVVAQPAPTGAFVSFNQFLFLLFITPR